MPQTNSAPPHPTQPGGVYPAQNRLRDLAVGERPQERLQRLGPTALSDTELLAMLLRSGTPGNDVLTLSTRLLAEAGSLAALIGWREADFRKMKGVGRVKALQLLTVMEISRRVIGQQTGVDPLLDRPELVVEYFRPIIAGLDVEKFWILCLNRRGRLIKCIEITSGTATSSLVHPREVFREAIRASAISIICVHNHPSGDPAPSPQDVSVTRQLRDAARTVGIEFTDHLIIGRTQNDPSGLGYYSFRATGIV